jgi:hypothetical protein
MARNRKNANVPSPQQCQNVQHEGDTPMNGGDMKAGTR